MGNELDENGMEVQRVESVGAIEAQERAAIDVQIATAKRYPRDIVRSKQKMLEMATVDVETAEGCFYTLKRKGKEGVKIIQGPSIRLAEIAATAWGNLSAGSRVVGNDRKNITAQAVAHDMEVNVRIMRETQRRITDKDGRTYSEDVQTLTANAACSIALRNAICSVVPKIFINSAYEAAKKVAIGDAKSLGQRFQAIAVKFQHWNKTEADLLAWLGKPDVKTLEVDDIGYLIGLGNSIKDGEQSLEEAFSKTREESPDLLPHKRGRPLGSKNQPKSEATSAGQAAQESGPAAQPEPAAPSPAAAIASGDAQHSQAFRELAEDGGDAADESAADAQPPACEEYEDLEKAQKRSARILGRAMQEVGVGALVAIRTDFEACRKVLAVFLRISAAAQGK